MYQTPGSTNITAGLSSAPTLRTFIPVERADLRQLEMRLTAIPGMKISYEINGYKKVSGDYFYVIPKGKKCIVWFTTYKMKPTALFFELDPRDHSKVNFITIRAPHPQCCDAELHAGEYGTVCYGTLFIHEMHQFFTIENIHVYKNVPVDSLSVDKKYTLIVSMFESHGLGRSAIDVAAAATVPDVADIPSTPQVAQQPKLSGLARIWFGLPIKCTSYAEALRISTGYAVYAIQARFGNQTDNKYYQNSQNSQNSQNQFPLHSKSQTLQPSQISSTCSSTGATALHRPQQASQGQRTFMLRADRQADLYSLICPVSGCVEPEYAHVGDYKTSVYMNSVFRRMKENSRLDAIEESDDESEFQNSDPDKHVNLEKTVLMLCSFNYRFKRWIPLKCVVSADGR